MTSSTMGKMCMFVVLHDACIRSLCTCVCAPNVHPQHCTLEGTNLDECAVTEHMDVL